MHLVSVGDGSLRARTSLLLGEDQSVQFIRSAAVELPGGFFQNTLLELLLTINAVPCPGHSVQSLGIDFFAAGDTLAEAALAEPGQSTLNHLQELAVIV